MGWSSRVLRAAAALGLLVAGGCLRSATVSCADGTTCPADTRCQVDSSGNDRCVTAAQDRACVGLADGETCTFGATVGICDLATCLPSDCGNHILDPSEGCDDGNTIGGDGCAADCAKLERCNDGVKDEGEACDDGNTNPADGCNQCVVTTWMATPVIGKPRAGTSIGINNTSGIAVDRAGYVYFAGRYDATVVRVDPAGAVIRIAGSRQAAAGTGEGGPATDAGLDLSYGVAADGLGNVYLAERTSVRKIDPRGIITTYAGGGTTADTVAGIPATQAALDRPDALAIDGLGNLYIGESTKALIHVVEPDGTIRIFAGTGTPGSTGDTGLATSAQILGTSSIATAGTDVFLVDGARIRRVDTITGKIFAYAGSGSLTFGGDNGDALAAGFESAMWVAADDSKTVYVATDSRVRRIDPTTHVITTIAGDGTPGQAAQGEGDGGPASAARIGRTYGLAASFDGNVFVMDDRGERVRRIAGGLATGTISTVLGTGAFSTSADGLLGSAVLDEPRAVAIASNGDVVFTDTQRVYRIDARGVVHLVAGSGVTGDSPDGGPAATAELGYINGVATCTQDRILIADYGNRRVRVVDANGIIGSLGPQGASGLELYQLACDPLTGDAIMRTDVALYRVTPGGTWTAIVSGDYGGPAVEPGTGEIYTANYTHNVIDHISSTGTVTAVVGTYDQLGTSGDGNPASGAKLNGPESLTFDSAGNLYIGCQDRVRKVTGAHATGTISTFAGGNTNGQLDGDGGAPTSASFGAVPGLAVGLDGTVYISTLEYLRAVKTGRITTIFGFVDPEGMGLVSAGHLAGATGFVIGSTMTVFAGGSTGTIQTLGAGDDLLRASAGRYLQFTAQPGSARFTKQTFPAIGGVALDEAAHTIYASAGNSIIAISMVTPTDPSTWTYTTFAGNMATGGYADGPLATARFRSPAGLLLHDGVLYIADRDNHAIRAIVPSAASPAVSTVAGVGAIRGFAGDGGQARQALFNGPEAVAIGPRGDMFIADTVNHRIRRVAPPAAAPDDFASGTVSTVLGTGLPASLGEGAPSSLAPVAYPRGLAFDNLGNLYVTSSDSVRLLAADAAAVVDGMGGVSTVYAPGAAFPNNSTRCLSGVASIDDSTVRVADACTGVLLELKRN